MYYLSHTPYQNELYNIDGMSYTIIDEEGNISSLNRNIVLVGASLCERGDIKDEWFRYYDYDLRDNSLICVDSYRIIKMYTEDEWNEKVNNLKIIVELSK